MSAGRHPGGHADLPDHAHAEHRPGHHHDAHDSHDHTHHHDHDHDHNHPTGVRGFLYDLFVPHTHDSVDAIDDALEASSAGIRALKISLAIMLATTVLQAGIFVVTNSVALLADTIHNLSDALTAVPLWIAFVLGRRAATERFTYGYGRAEDLAGLFIVLVIALSAVVAAWESIRRLIEPAAMQNPWIVFAAGLIGFAGNEAVAIYRTRVGRRIGSAALVADGVHARVDGFTSLAVVVGAIGALVGLPILDPIIGLVIAASIVALLIGTVKSVGSRLMDAVDPDLVDEVRHALEHTEGVADVAEVRLRWVGHRLHGDAAVRAEASDVRELEHLVRAASGRARAGVRYLERFDVRCVPTAAHSPEPRSDKGE